MTGRDADLKIISFSMYHWGFIKKIDSLSVWNGERTFYDDSEGLVKELRSPFTAIRWRWWGELQHGMDAFLKIPF